MDARRFDRLARELSARTSRRGVLGGLLGLGAGLVGRRVAEAACLPGRVSRPRVGCVCRLTGRPPVGGVCPCPRGQTDTGDGRGCLACRSDQECDDSDPCTIATCDPTGTCLHPSVEDGQQGECPVGQVCLAGTCQLCGGPAQPCCAEDACSVGLSCQAGTCLPCGVTGLPCCAGDVCSLPNTVCLSGTCLPCGFVGTPCCPGNFCTVGICQAGTCM